jgi:hypothetical protein
MKRALFVLALLCVPQAALAQQQQVTTTTVSPDQKMVTTTSELGTTTTEVIPNGTGSTTISTFQPRSGSQTTGAGNSGENYKPMGQGGYQPMGR